MIEKSRYPAATRPNPHFVPSAMEAMEIRRHLSATLIDVVKFNGPYGGGPAATLLLDGAGALFGTTLYGGVDNDGVVYEIAPNSNAITPLGSFDNINSGIGPRSNLLLDASGNFYGTTTDGGPNDNGTIFKFDTASNTLTTVANFNGANGASPDSGLIAESDGNYYGVTNSDNGGTGVYYRFSPSTNTITALATFNESTTGSNPKDQLFLDANGNLYGTTRFGGTGGDGTVFEILAGSNTITPLAAFNGANGMTPIGGVVVDAQGDIFGAARLGGANNLGTVYEIVHGSNTITSLADFNNSNGAYPEGGLIIDAAGNLFGTATQGGDTNVGTVFELPAGSNTITRLAEFNINNGATPEGNLIADSSGNLYGITYSGGNASDGVVFKLTGSGFVSTSFATLSNGILSVQGTALNDSISISQTNGSITATLNGATSAPFTGVTGISVAGGAGNDTISAANVTTNATLLGASGNDSMTGGAGNDSLRGGAGTDTLAGGAGDDTLIGGGSNDSIKGGAGNDSLFGGPGNDTLKGGVGNDTLGAGLGSDSINGNLGNDSIYAGSGASKLDGGPGANIIIGSTTSGYAADTINAYSGADSIIAGVGDSILYQASNDTVTRS